LMALGFMPVEALNHFGKDFGCDGPAPGDLGYFLEIFDLMPGYEGLCTLSRGLEAVGCFAFSNEVALLKESGYDVMPFDEAGLPCLDTEHIYRRSFDQGVVYIDKHHDRG